MSYREDVNDSAYIDPPAGKTPVVKVRLDRIDAGNLMEEVFELLQEAGYIADVIEQPSWVARHPDIAKRVCEQVQDMAEDSAEVEFE